MHSEQTELSEHSRSTDRQRMTQHPSHNHRRDPIPSDQTVVGLKSFASPIYMGKFPLNS